MERQDLYLAHHELASKYIIMMMMMTTSIIIIIIIIVITIITIINVVQESCPCSAAHPTDLAWHNAGSSQNYRGRCPALTGTMA